MISLRERKGSLGGSHGSKGKLKKLLEGSTLVDLLTIGVLVFNFMLLRDAGATGYNASLLQAPGSQEMLAAQLTGLVIGIYIIEAIIDSAGD